MRVIFFLLVCTNISYSALAQKQRADAAADSIYALPAIEITAFRGWVNNEFAPARISKLDSTTIAASASHNLAELLDRTGGPFIRQYGTGLSTLTFRGTSSAQTLILLDGIPISDPQLGQIDLSILPTSLLEEVELLHGQSSASYGSQSIGGVINLKTLRSKAPFFFQTKVSAGAYGERNGQATAGINKGKAGGLVSVSYGSEKGDFPYLNQSLFPPQTSRREGADRNHFSAFGSLTINHQHAHTTVTGWFNDVERGLPGTASVTPKHERQWDRNGKIQAIHVLPVALGLLSLKGGVQKNSLRYQNPQLEIDQTGRTSASFLDIELSHIELPSLDIATGVSGSYYEANHPNLQGGASESRISWFTNAAWSNTRAGAFPALRIDAIIPGSGKRLAALSPSLGFNIKPLAASRFRLKGSVGRAFRAPTFNDRFWQPGGNPDLNSEQGWSYEAGAIYPGRHDRSVGKRPATATLEASVYLHHIRNQITWVPDDRNIWSPHNLGHTKTLGSEISARSSIDMSRRTRISGWIAYSFVDSRDISDQNLPTYDQPLRYVPRHVLKTLLGIEGQANRWRWNFDFIARRVSRRYVTTDGSQFLWPYFAADVNVRSSFQAKRGIIELGFFFENLTDEAFEIVKGYPTPPRSLRFQLSIQWSGRSSAVASVSSQK